MRVSSQSIIILLLSITLLVGCSSVEVTTQQDYWPTEQWRYLAPEEQGMDGDLISHLLGILPDENVQGITIVRNGYIVGEYSKPPFTNETAQNIHGITKSIISTLVGIAIQAGYIDSVDQPISDFFEEILTDSSINPEFQHLTIRHLLTMTSGVEWHESGDWNGDLKPFSNSRDWIKAFLNQPVIHEPGEIYNFNSGSSHILSAIIQRATGMETATFAQEMLYTSLGISPSIWHTDPQGIHNGMTGLYMSPHDLAKIGLLYLNDGVWEGEQILPETWVEEALQSQSEGLSYLGHYGYQWWVSSSFNNRYRVLFAYGSMGQYLFLVPELNLVVVVTGNFSATETYLPIDYLNSYIISSVKKQ